MAPELFGLLVEMGALPVSADLFNRLVALGEYEMAGKVLVQLFIQQAEDMVITVPEEVWDNEDPTN